MGLSIAAWIPCGEDAYSNRLSSSHSVALMEVLEDAFGNGNNSNSALWIGMTVLQRERLLAITPHGQVESGTVVRVQGH